MGWPDVHLCIDQLGAIQFDTAQLIITVCIYVAIVSMIVFTWFCMLHSKTHTATRILSLPTDVSSWVLQEGSAKNAQSLADELAAEKEQTQKALAEAEKALANLKNQTVDAQKAAEEKLKALSLDQNALDEVPSQASGQHRHNNNLLSSATLPHRNRKSLIRYVQYHVSCPSRLSPFPHSRSYLMCADLSTCQSPYMMSYMHVSFSH